MDLIGPYPPDRKGVLVAGALEVATIPQAPAFLIKAHGGEVVAAMSIFAVLGIVVLGMTRQPLRGAIYPLFEVVEILRRDRNKRLDFRVQSHGN